MYVVGKRIFMACLSLQDRLHLGELVLVSEKTHQFLQGDRDTRLENVKSLPCYSKQDASVAGKGLNLFRDKLFQEFYLYSVFSCSTFNSKARLVKTPD